MSNIIKSFQKKIGITADGVFENNTITAAMNFYKLTPLRASHFFGQISCETNNFKNFSELCSEYAFESAIFFFEKNKLWDICDKGIDNDTILKITKYINGKNDLSDRIALINKYYNILTQQTQQAWFK